MLTPWKAMGSEQQDLDEDKTQGQGQVSDLAVMSAWVQVSALAPASC